MWYIKISEGLCLLLIQLCIFLLMKQYFYLNPTRNYNTPRISFIDRLTYYPWTNLIYFSWIFYAISIFFFIPEERHIHFFILMLSIIILNTGIQWFLPMNNINEKQDHYPQLKIKLDNDANLGFIHKYADKIQYFFNQNLCALPSIVCTFITIPILFLTLSQHGNIYCILILIVWSTSIFSSILTTKQNYALNLLGSICLNIFFFYEINYLLKICDIIL